jgi:hypothetical protein
MNAIVFVLLMVVTMPAIGASQQRDRTFQKLEYHPPAIAADSAHGTRVGPALKAAGIGLLAGLGIALFVDQVTADTEGRLETYIAIPVLAAVGSLATVFVASNR